MPKIKIFSEKNVQKYGFTGKEIDELNAEWERKAAELDLEEHLPEYWQEAKRHMSEKLEGRVAESSGESGNKQLDGEPAELPSLDVNLDDFDIAGENEITAVDLSDEEIDAEFLSDELSGLESISFDDLEPEVIPEGQTVSFAEMTEESAAVEGLEFEEEEAVEETAIAEEPELEVEEAALEKTIADEGRAEEIAVEEKIVPVDKPELQSVDAAQKPETVAEESAREVIAEEEVAPVEEQKKESFFAKIIGHLKRIFSRK